MWFSLVEHDLQSANSDVFSFPKSVMLTRCAFIKSRLQQLQHMVGIRPNDAFVMSANRRVPSSNGPRALGITWHETISTAEAFQRAKISILRRTFRKRRRRLVGHVIRMQSRCQTPLGTLLTTVPKNCHLWQGHGCSATLQHNDAFDLRSVNCDVTSISGLTKSCFFNLVDTLD